MHISVKRIFKKIKNIYITHVRLCSQSSLSREWFSAKLLRVLHGPNNTHSRPRKGPKLFPRWYGFIRKLIVITTNGHGRKTIDDPSRYLIRRIHSGRWCFSHVPVGTVMSCVLEFWKFDRISNVTRDITRAYVLTSSYDSDENSSSFE